MRTGNMQTSRAAELPDSTLGELRWFVESCADMPDEAVVRVKVRWSSNAAGAPVRRITAANEPPAGSVKR